MTARPLRLFEGYGIELEYMIVDADDLRVRPLTDRVLQAVTGDWVGDYEEGPIAWSNELVLHVIELKTNGPVPSLRGVSDAFVADLRRIQGLLEPLGARLMPTAMHPFMDPATETVLWPHESNPIYEKFDEIFDCRGHGWSNLQSMHVNLPFSGDEQFGRLHAAIRFLMPLLPGLAASSPIMDGRATGKLDNRMEVYRHNARRVPSVSGSIVPEPAATRAEYESRILARIYDDLAPFDPEGVLRYEWANARGCIARFDRDAIEIRVLDLQETPRVDLAIAALVSAGVKGLCDGGGIDREGQDAWDTEQLAALFRATLTSAEQTRIDDEAYLEALGVPGRGPRTVGEVWSHLLDASSLRTHDPDAARTLDFLLERGSLARRIVRAVGSPIEPAQVRRVYRRLSECLIADEMFDDRAGLDA